VQPYLFLANFEEGLFDESPNRFEPHLVSGKSQKKNTRCFSVHYGGTFCISRFVGSSC